MFSRSRPWRARGPAFGSGFGSRRRGRRTQSLTTASALTFSEVIAADDAAVVSTWPVEAPIADEPPPIAPAHVSVARIDESGLRAIARRAHELAQVKPVNLAALPERLSPATLVQLVSQRGDDASHRSRSRHSA